jgi:hypothetical protein
MWRRMGKSPASPWKKKLWQDRSKGHAMLELFVNSSETVHMYLIPEGVTKQAPLQGDTSLSMQFIRCEHPGLWRRRNWLLLHLYTALCLSKRRWQNTVLPRSPYSPDLLPCDLFSFPSWKKSYVGTDFGLPRTSSLPQGKPYRTFLQICFSSVSSSYTTAGRLA